MQAERGLAGRGLAVDPHDPARQAAFAAGRLQSGADGEPAVRRVEGRGDRPEVAPGSSPPSAREWAAADFVEPGPAQAAAGRQEGQRLQEVGLAHAIAADQHDRLQSAIEAELAVVAEIGEAELADGQHGAHRRLGPVGRRGAGTGVGRKGAGAAGLRGHTRIGMST